MRLRRRAGFWLAALAAATAAPAEQPPAPDGSGIFADEVSVGYVLVPVSVHSKRGAVTDLEASEFRLLADDRPVAFDWFERGGEAPLELVILQDLSGSMALRGKLEASRRAVRCFLERLRPTDRYALASFAGRRLAVEVPFTDDRTAGREAMSVWLPYGVTALHDAVARLPEIRPAGRTARAALLITDGAENASRLDPEQATEIVRRAELPVYILSLAGPAAAPATAAAPSYAAILRRLAEVSGGRYLSIQEPERLEAACVSVLEELRSRYVLGFPTAQSGEARWRRLRVLIDQPGLRIRGRGGYRGRPPADASTDSVP